MRNHQPPPTWDDVNIGDLIQCSIRGNIDYTGVFDGFRKRNTHYVVVLRVADDPTFAPTLISTHMVKRLRILRASEPKPEDCGDGSAER
jgi:hypothetical protein